MNRPYIVKTRMFKETPIGDGSVLDVLKVLPDGTVTEVGSVSCNFAGER
jgi:hypothetical protein